MLHYQDQLSSEICFEFISGPLTAVHYNAFPQERHEITLEYARLRNSFSTP